jgi:hypothetical protein
VIVEATAEFATMDIATTEATNHNLRRIAFSTVLALSINRKCASARWHNAERIVPARAQSNRSYLDQQFTAIRNKPACSLAADYSLSQSRAVKPTNGPTSQR